MYLITNYHVISGYDPVTEQPLHSTGALPNRLRFKVPTKHFDENGAWKGVHYRELVPDVRDENDQPLWLNHPVWDRQVDVVALPLGPETTVRCWTIDDTCADDDAFSERFELLPGQDAFVLGYPKGISIARHLPLWKRATIASEPSFDVDGKPTILIDTATRKGMSGAPVIAQVQGFWYPQSKKDKDDWRIGQGRQFIGVYSGRLGGDEFEAQVGFVWKSGVIQEIVNQSRPGGA